MREGKTCIPENNKKNYIYGVGEIYIYSHFLGVEK